MEIFQKLEPAPYPQHGAWTMTTWGRKNRNGSKYLVPDRCGIHFQTLPKSRDMYALGTFPTGQRKWTHASPTARPSMEPQNLDATWGEVGGGRKLC